MEMGVPVRSNDWMQIFSDTPYVSFFVNTSDIVTLHTISLHTI